MIALVAGEVAARGPDGIVIETASGVGYRVAVSSETLARVPATGGEVSLLTHLVVREDALSLYGFATESERELFLLLIGVQSVGPKMALAVLSGGPPGEIVRAVAAGDTKRLTAVPGIGRRTAERIVVELREQAGVIADAALVVPAEDGGEIGAGRGAGDAHRLAREALVSLGFEPDEAVRLLAGAEGDGPEQLVGQALRAARA